jgi:hypothetical protein
VLDFVMHYAKDHRVKVVEISCFSRFTVHVHEK